MYSDIAAAFRWLYSQPDRYEVTACHARTTVLRNGTAYVFAVHETYLVKRGSALEQMLLSEGIITKEEARR